MQEEKAESPKQIIAKKTTYQEPKDTKPKTTLNLGNLFKPITSKEVTTDEKPKITSPDKPMTDEELSKAWSALTESRKDQAATYQLLSRGYQREGNTLTIHLNNPVEEPLLISIKTDLVSYLRETLGNNSLQLKSHLADVAASKMIYTNKEKFEAMAEKNPLLKDLRDKFGLDPDF